MIRLIFTLAILGLLVLSCVAQSQQTVFVPAPGSPIAVGASPGDFLLADANKDGNLDIIAASGAPDLRVWLGDGKGGFGSAPGSPFKTSMAMHLAVAGDLNKDGNLDLVLTNHDSHDVAVLSGNGKGGFAPAAGSPFTSGRKSKAHNHGLGLEDVNEDGHLDIITGDQDDNSVSVLLSNTRGGFSPATGSPFTVGKGPYPLALGDINGDGKIDIVTPNTGSHDASVLLGDGKGSFAAAPGSPISVGTRPYFAAIADLNADKKLDVITVHDDSSLMTVLLNDGKGKFRVSSFDLGRRGWEAVVADVNRDNRMDVVAATNDSVTILLGDGRGGFAPRSSVPTGPGAWRVAAGDLNRDGKLDLVTSNLEGKSLTILLGK